MCRNETDETFDLYGRNPQAGTFAANCLLARVRGRGSNSCSSIIREGSARESAARHRTAMPRRLIRLRRRSSSTSSGAACSTTQLVVWGGEFAGTVFAGKLTSTNYGRIITRGASRVEGGGVVKRLVYGATDDFSYNVTDGAVHVHDFHATLLHLLGVDHER